MLTKTITKVKICGLFRECDIDYVNRYKPDFAGFIFWPKSHRYVTDEKAAALRQKLDKDIKAVGVFVDESRERIADIANKGIIDIIQLHGNETDEDIRYLKAATGKQVIKAVKIKDGSEIAAWDDSSADYLLLDSGMGTGKPFDWNTVGKRPKKEFFLAGGLGAENIQEAIKLFSPFAVDLSSSVETDKVKDAEKIKTVIERVRGFWGIVT